MSITLKYIKTIMIILSLKLSNFMNIKFADLTFQKGINVLSGKNGQGKSAVFEAVSFCLTGRRRGDSWKDYIKSGTDKFSIDLLINHKGQDIRFLFSGEKNVQAMSKIIKAGTLTYSNSECDAFLEELFDVEMLENVMFTMQDSPSIASMTSGERRGIFKKVFNTDFTEALAKIKEDQEALTFKRINTQADLRALESKQYHMPEGRVEIVDEYKLKVFKEELPRLTETRDEFVSLLEKAKNERSTIEDLIKANRENAATLDRKIDQAKWWIDSFKEVKAQDEIDALYSIKSSQGERLDLLAYERHQLSENLKDSLNSDFASQDKEQSSSIYKTKSELSLVETQIKTSEKGSCVSCGQECPSTHLDHLRTDRDFLSTKLTILEETYTKLKDKQKRYLELVSKGSVLDVKEASLKEANKNLQRNIELKEKELLETKNSIDLLKKELESFEASKSILGSERFELEGILSNYIPLDTIRNLITENDSRLNFVNKNIWELESILKVNAEKQKVIDRVKVEQKEDAKRKEELLVLLNSGDQEEKDISSIRQIFEIHLPNYINQQACDVLQSYMTTFLNNSKEDFKVLLQQSKKGIDFLYKATKDSDWLQAKLASGFESALLTLAFKCAVASAYGAELLILDEPDKAATESASAQLFQTITEDLKSGFEQIFIITHRNNSLEYLQENDALIYRVHQGSFEIYE